MFAVFPLEYSAREIIGKFGVIPALSRNCEVMYNAECIIYYEFNSTFLILNYTLKKPGALP